MMTGGKTDEVLAHLVLLIGFTRHCSATLSEKDPHSCHCDHQ